MEKSLNAVSFGLFGNDPKYCQGAIRNAELIGQFYPGWQMVVYAEENVPENITLRLTELGVRLIGTSLSAMISRFLIADEVEYERFVVRDADSRFTEREVAAVKAWIESGLGFHVMRDHPGHGNAMLAGMWGGRTGKLNMANLFEQWQGSKDRGDRSTVYGRCTTFLRDMVWPIIHNDVIQHDLCFRGIFSGSIPFPVKSGERFVGEVIEADDRPRDGEWQSRMEWLKIYLPSELYEA